MNIFFKKIVLIGAILSLSLTISKKTKKENCEIKFNKEELIAAGQLILDQGENENIWNLHELDTSEFYAIDDYFISPDEKTKLVLIGGIAGGSSGSADNLLMIVKCYDDEINILWAGQFGDITENGIVDINNDGIKEVVSNSELVWMGECHEFNSVYNFTSEDDVVLFKSHSYSFIDCGTIDLSSHTKGDTLELGVKFELINRENRFFVEEYKTFKIHNGGKDDKAVLKNMIMTMDTVYTLLK